MSNREIRFDVFENAELSQIEQIGIDENMIDDEAKNRMYRIAQKKYKKMSGTNKMNNGDDFMDSVSGVERINKKGTSRIVMSVCAIAATLVLVIGGVALFNGKVAKPPVSPDPFTGVGTSTSTTLGTGKSTGTGTGTGTDTGTSTTAVSGTTVTTTGSTDVDLSQIQSAGSRVLDGIVADKSEPYSDIKYSYTDINNDSVPELIVTGYPLSGDTKSYLYFFNGSDYVNSGEALHNIEYCPDNNYVATCGKNQRYAVFNATDNYLALIEEVDYSDYYNSVNNFVQKYGLNGVNSVYNWKEPEYTFYAEHNGAVIDDPATLRISLNPSSLVSQGLLPAGEYTVCYQFIDDNMVEQGGGVADPDTQFSSDTEGFVSRCVPYNPGCSYRFGIELYDNVNDVRISDLCIAEVNYETEEINIISDRTNGAATFSFEVPDGMYY